MNKVSIALIFVLFCVTIYTSSGISVHEQSGLEGLDAAEYYGVGVWNNHSNINVGLVGLINSKEAIQMFVIPRHFVPYNYFQPTAYNYLTKTLTVLGADNMSDVLSIFTIDCQSWTLIKTVPVSQYSVLGGLSSLQSDDNSLMGFYTMIPAFYAGYVYKMLLSAEGTAVTVGGTQATYRGSVFDSDSQVFYFAFQNTSGLFIQSYDTSYTMQSEKEFTFVNTNKLASPTNGPLDMYYDSNSKSIWVGVYMASYLDYNCGGFAIMDWDNGNLVVQPNLVTPPLLIVVALTTIPSNTGVSVLTDLGGFYYIYTWNTVTNEPLSQRPYKTPLMAIY
ncbi:hypothetical protein CYY_003860 [Polysphondylium violaceum]|uniref:Uncharacterized protein n=1 Tax=Polysphondylium violaceum TaxID=133409 RepID=A0A8J4V8A7_9MYCE|nr:hypothetical protein CYY_003860 [Polysphondylium violaceum]